MPKQLLIVMAGLLISAPALVGQRPANQAELDKILGFEMEHTGSLPAGWDGGPAGTIFVDGEVVHGGRWSVRFERKAGSPETVSSITKTIPIDFAGKTIELSGFLRTEDVSGFLQAEGMSGFVGMLLQEDGDSGPVAWDNMQKRQLKGTTGWAEYSITLPLKPDAKRLVFGVGLVGTGKAWADDLRLLVDGKPIGDAPKIERPKTGIDLDHEFDGGSRISMKELTKVQIENLATLGKVWGFLKYHHPLITAGQHHWDYDLFRVMPAILAARDRAAANAALVHWIHDLGPVEACKACAKLDKSGLYVRPDLQWIRDEARLGADLSRSLCSIHANRPVGKQLAPNQPPRGQFYVSLGMVGNPSFEHELAYSGIKLPDAGFQILAAYRFWNIIEYWFPNRDVLGENWDEVLLQFIPRIALAKDADAYQRELMALIARAHDTHANLWSSLRARPPAGDCLLPVNVRFIENRPVVAGYTAADAGGLRVGDIISKLDGAAVSELVENWTPYYAASNDPARLRDIGGNMSRGGCVDTRVRVLRQGEVLEIRARRLPFSSLNWKSGRTHDLPGETFRLLSDKVAYLKLSSVKAAEAAHYIQAAAGTKGLIIDIRNYPSEFVVFALGSLLVDKKTAFANFTYGDLSNPGAFRWMEAVTLGLRPPEEVL